MPPGGREALAPLRSIAGPGVPDAVLQRGLMALAALGGTVSFELFGQLHAFVGDQPGDREAFFAESVRRWAEQIGASPGRTGPRARKPRHHLEPVGTAEATATAQDLENSTSQAAEEVSS